jgi:hypothetical protein
MIICDQGSWLTFLIDGGLTIAGCVVLFVVLKPIFLGAKRLLTETAEDIQREIDSFK